MDKVSRIGQLKPIAFNGSLVRFDSLLLIPAIGRQHAGSPLFGAEPFRNADPRGRVRENRCFRAAAANSDCDSTSRYSV